MTLPDDSWLKAVLRPELQDKLDLFLEYNKADTISDAEDTFGPLVNSEKSVTPDQLISMGDLATSQDRGDFDKIVDEPLYGEPTRELAKGYLGIKVYNELQSR